MYKEDDGAIGQFAFVCGFIDLQASITFKIFDGGIAQVGELAADDYAKVIRRFLRVEERLAY